MCPTSTFSPDAVAVPTPLSAFGAGAGMETAPRTSTGAEPVSPLTSSPKAKRAPMTEEEAAERRRAKARQKSEDKIVALVKAQGHVRKTNCSEAVNGSYFSLPTGRVLNFDIIDRLIKAGRLSPCADGLFDDAQTWVLA